MELLSLLNNKEKELGKIVHLKKNHILFHENEKCEHIGIVLFGSLTISSYSLNGREIIYNFINKDEMFGNNLIFSDKPFFRGNVIANSDSKIFLINKENLLKIFANNKEFLLKFLSFNAEFTKRLNFQIKLLSLASAEERLTYYLEESNPLSFKNVSSLAKTLHLSRETLSRLLTKLINEKVINRKGNILYLIKSV